MLSLQHLFISTTKLKWLKLVNFFFLQNFNQIQLNLSLRGTFIILRYRSKCPIWPFTFCKYPSEYLQQQKKATASNGNIQCNKKYPQGIITLKLRIMFTIWFVFVQNCKLWVADKMLITLCNKSVLCLIVSSILN